jgi:hypothetical protein
MSAKEEETEAEDVDYDKILGEQEKHKKYLANELEIAEMERKLKSMKSGKAADAQPEATS